MSPIIEEKAIYPGLGWKHFLCFVATLAVVGHIHGDSASEWFDSVYWYGCGLLNSYLYWKFCCQR